ncbi:MAG: cytochrome-c oxidase, cbb3-type subunit II [Rhodospirillales bacterium]
MLAKHHVLERNVILLIVFIVLTISIGGIVEIVPLFTIKETIEPVKGVRPYSPLELAGRDIYVREGCYNCHSQMIRPFRDEVERYGHYSLAAESMYDHPFQWGSKRTGPDLARVGGKYSNEWHVEHLLSPPSVVPGSVMPPYPFLAERGLDPRAIGRHMATLRLTGVPYTDDMIKNAAADMASQTQPDADNASLLQRYPRAAVADFDGDSKRLTEMDALIAYLQVLGTMVDFTTYRPEFARNAGR